MRVPSKIVIKLAFIRAAVRRMSLFMNMDRMIGTDFEAGLANENPRGGEIASPSFCV